MGRRGREQNTADWDYISDNAYERLALAIVKQASEDYKSELNKKKPNKDDVYDRRELEEFFTSQWFQRLADADGEWYLNELRRRF